MPHSYNRGFIYLNIKEVVLKQTLYLFIHGIYSIKIYAVKIKAKLNEKIQMFVF